MHYTYTPLESWMKNLYNYLSIKVPEELDMIDISAKLNIWLHHADVESTAVEHNNFYSLIIDRRLSKEQRWEDFGHELCHLLRHAGNQMMLSDSMVMLQEAQANNFALHFCIPTFMLLQRPIPLLKEDFIYDICATFNVTYPFAKKRIEHFENQLLGIQLHKHIQALTQKKALVLS